LKKDSESVIKDIQNENAEFYQNHKRHMQLLSFLLYHEKVKVCCFIWPLTLLLWSDSFDMCRHARQARQTGRQARQTGRHASQTDRQTDRQEDNIKHDNFELFILFIYNLK